MDINQMPAELRAPCKGWAHTYVAFFSSPETQACGEQQCTEPPGIISLIITQPAPPVWFASARDHPVIEMEGQTCACPSAENV